MPIASEKEKRKRKLTEKALAAPPTKKVCSIAKKNIGATKIATSLQESPTDGSQESPLSVNSADEDVNPSPTAPSASSAKGLTRRRAMVTNEDEDDARLSDVDHVITDGEMETAEQELGEL